MKKSRFSTLCFVFVVAARVFAVEQFGIQRWKANGKTNLMISKYLKIGRLQPEKSRNKFTRIQKMKKSRFSTLCFVFVVAVWVFAVKQFPIQRWKANGKTNLMISKHLKIGRLQPEKLRNTKRIQNMKTKRNESKTWRKAVCVQVQYVHSNPNTLLLISRGPADKNQKLFLTQLSL